MSKLVRACAASLSALLLGASFTAPASANYSLHSNAVIPASDSVRVTGTIQQLVVDNIADHNDLSHGHAGDAAMITYLLLGEQRIELDANNTDLSQLAAGSNVVVDLAVAPNDVPAQAFGMHNQLSANVAEEFAVDLGTPVSAEIVDVVSQPDISVSTQSTINHTSVVVLPVPTDYNGDVGNCTVDVDEEGAYVWDADEAECNLPQTTNWQDTNGPLSVARAAELMGANQSYWVSQTRETIAQIASTKIVHVKVPATADFLCNGDPNALMTKLWGPLADTYGIGGYDDNTSHNSLVVFSGSCESPTDGFAFIGAYGLESSSITQIRNDNAPTLIHEFGHIFSLGHSNLEIVDGPLAGSQPASIDYLGMYSPMQLTLMNSSTGRAFDSPALDGVYEILYGLDREGEVLQIEESGEYVLSERTGTAGVRTMIINEPDEGDEGTSHIVELRSGTGQDAGAFYATSMRLWDSASIAYAPGVRVYTFSQSSDGTNTQTYTASRFDSKTNTYLTSFGAGSSLTLFDDTTLEVVSVGNGQARIKITAPEPVPVPEKAVSALAAPAVSGAVKSAIAVPYSISSSPAEDFTGTVRALLDEVVLAEQSVAGVSGSASGSIKLPTSLPAGTHSITLQFVDSQTVKNSTTTVKVTVSKRSLSSLTLSAPTSTYGKSTKATVTAKGSLAPSGTVKFYVDGKYYKSASIKSGKATVTLSSTLKAGKHSIKASFPSSSVYNSKSVSTTLTVKKLKGAISGSPTGTKYVKVGSSYSKKVTLNATGKLQRRVDGEWRSIKTLSKGTSTVKFSVGKTTKAQKYRVIVSSTSNVTGTAAKSFIIRPKR